MDLGYPRSSLNHSSSKKGRYCWRRNDSSRGVRSLLGVESVGASVQSSQAPPNLLKELLHPESVRRCAWLPVTYQILRARVRGSTSMEFALADMRADYSAMAIEPWGLPASGLAALPGVLRPPLTLR